MTIQQLILLFCCRSISCTMKTLSSDIVFGHCLRTSEMFSGEQNQNRFIGKNHPFIRFLGSIVNGWLSKFFTLIVETRQPNSKDILLLFDEIDRILSI